MLQIHITTGAKVPIYRQVVDRIRSAIATGKLAAGDPLPSVRALASELVVNPNTIAKAYAQLVHDGQLESHQGRGYFVAEPRDIYTEAERQRRLDESLGPVVAEALTLGFKEQDVIDAIKQQFRRMAKS